MVKSFWILTLIGKADTDTEYYRNKSFRQHELNTHIPYGLNEHIVSNLF